MGPPRPGRGSGSRLSPATPGDGADLHETLAASLGSGLSGGESSEDSGQSPPGAGRELGASGRGAGGRGCRKEPARPPGASHSRVPCRPSCERITEAGAPFPSFQGVAGGAASGLHGAAERRRRHTPAGCVRPLNRSPQKGFKSRLPFHGSKQVRRSMLTCKGQGSPVLAPGPVRVGELRATARAPPARGPRRAGLFLTVSHNPCLKQALGAGLCHDPHFSDGELRLWAVGSLPAW